MRLISILCLLALSFSQGYAQRPAAVYISTDNGRSWEMSDACFPDEAIVTDFGVFGSDAIAGTDAHGVFVSHDAGRHWSRSANGLPEKLKINAIASTQKAIFIGTDGDGIFASLDAGQSWHAASRGLTNKQVRRLAADGESVFAGTNGGVFVSQDDGKSWSHLTGTGQINGITILRGNIYIADLEGVLHSGDRGRTWRRILADVVPHNLSNDGESVYAMLYSEGVRKTADGGTSWISAQTGLPDDLSLYTFQILHVDGQLFAGQWSGIYASADRGASWSRMPQVPPGSSITDLISLGEQTILAGAVPFPEE